MLKATFSLIPAGDVRSLPGVRISISSDNLNALEYVRINLLSRIENISLNNVDIRTVISIVPGITTYWGEQRLSSFNIEVHLLDLSFARQVADIVLNKVKELYDEYISFENEFGTYFNPNEVDLENTSGSGSDTGGSDDSAAEQGDVSNGSS